MADKLSRWHQAATTEHLDEVQKTVRDRVAKSQLRKVWRKKKLTAQRPYLRTMGSEPMGPAAEFGDREAPPRRDPTPRAVFERHARWYGVQSDIGRTAKLYQNLEAIVDLGGHIGDSMMTRFEKNQVDPFTNAGWDGTHKTWDDEAFFSAAHKIPGGLTFGNINGITLEYGFDNCIEAIEFVQLTHVDANGEPLSWFRGEKIRLVIGVKLEREVTEDFETTLKPNTADNTINYLRTHFNIEVVIDPRITDKRWHLVSENAKLWLIEFIPMQTFTDNVFGVNVTRTAAMAFYAFATEEARGTFGSKGGS